MARTKSKQASVHAAKHRKPARKGAKPLVTKQALMIDLLQRPQGASIDDLTRATGWQAHSVRGAISGTIKMKLGLMVTSNREDNRGQVYRIADAA